MKAETHDFDNCPVCLGLCMVIRCDHAEYGKHMNRLFAKEMIDFMERDPDCNVDYVSPQEWLYAYPQTTLEDVAC